MILSKDREEILGLGMNVDAVGNQLRQFEEGFPFLPLKDAATPPVCIRQIDSSQKAYYILKYDRYEGRCLKFVPASGAATRMFKSLYEARDLFESGADTDTVFGKLPDVKHLFNNLHKFAFYPVLASLIRQKGIDLGGMSSKQHSEVLALILSEEGLNYGNLPKGLILFHAYGDKARTAAAEHLAEGIAYSKGKSGEVGIHFTVSPQHLEPFKKEAAGAALEFGNTAKFNISFSVQKPETDTIAVNLDNTPFRDVNEKLVFRPAGHGALLENLNDLDADIIFIKNIDNVVPDSLKAETVDYKKVIAGLLLDIQEKSFTILRAIDEGRFREVEKDALELFGVVNEDIGTYDDMDTESKIAFLKSLLNRPVRVCGMVKNQGEPGGGPFVAKNSQGRYSLQVVESSQIDMKNPKQKSIFESSTHFNPVDLVCGIKDYTGKKFDLREFRDLQTGFISVKSKDGKDLKAMELPGLWNGAMSNWITLFVEVPLITFNPVKTVNDLLRKEHQ